jgi:hypothetical protein
MKIFYCVIKFHKLDLLLLILKIKWIIDIPRLDTNVVPIRTHSSGVAEHHFLLFPSMLRAMRSHLL